MIGIVGEALYYVAMPIGAFYVLWLFYLAVMNLVRARDAGTLSRTAYVLGFPFFLIGIVLDILLNWTLMSIILIEWPRETTITARLRRHYRTPGTWRYKVADWFGDVLLNPFDPSGVHIK